MSEKKEKLKKLEEEAKRPDFWDNPERGKKVSKKISALREEVDLFSELRKEVGDLLEIVKLSQEEEEGIMGEAKDSFDKLRQRIDELSLRKYLSGRWDERDAVLEIHAGAGGREAEDWTAMLRRMYERYAGKKGFDVRVLDISYGEPGGPEGRIGVKKVVMEVAGSFAFGYLKKEAGVHRLVRISPFSPQSLRHTSFAQVVVFPQLEDIKEAGMDIKKSNLKIETFRSSGPGGQYMQKTETAVRITHLPTGITVSCQAERSQGKNKEKAMNMLYAKLLRRKREKREKSLEKIKGKIDPAWGHQIRSYVLHPYQMVKDLRTEVEVSDPESVLDGELEPFIKEEIRL